MCTTHYLFSIATRVIHCFTEATEEIYCCPASDKTHKDKVVFRLPEMTLDRSELQLIEFFHPILDSHLHPQRENTPISAHLNTHLYKTARDTQTCSIATYMHVCAHSDTQSPSQELGLTSWSMCDRPRWLEADIPLPRGSARSHRKLECELGHTRRGRKRGSGHGDSTRLEVNGI